MRALAAVLVLLFAASGCGSSGPKRIPRFTTPPETTAGVSLESPRTQQIALARDSNPFFSIFPVKPGSEKCVIPGGGMRTTPLRGVCATRIRAARTHEPELVVSFTEWWLDPPCPPGMACVMAVWRHHTWRVRETEPMVTTGARLRVWPALQSGSPAPQIYK